MALLLTRARPILAAARRTAPTAPSRAAAANMAAPPPPPHRPAGGGGVGASADGGAGRAPRRAGGGVGASAADGAGGVPSSAAPPAAPAPIRQMSVQALRHLLAGGDAACADVQFVDVREPGEFSAAKLPRFKLFPLSDASTWAPNVEATLDRERKTICLCHHGIRSMNAAAFFAGQKGFADVWNVTGGIDAYSLEADESVPRY